MTDIKKGKQKSLGSSSTRSQQSKLHSALGLEPLESRLTKNDLEKLKDLFMVGGCNVNAFIKLMYVNYCCVVP